MFLLLKLYQVCWSGCHFKLIILKVQMNSVHLNSVVSFFLFRRKKITEKREILEQERQIHNLHPKYLVINHTIVIENTLLLYEQHHWYVLHLNLKYIFHVGSCHLYSDITIFFVFEVYFAKHLFRIKCLLEERIYETLRH